MSEGKFVSVVRVEWGTVYVRVERGNDVCANNYFRRPMFFDSPKKLEKRIIKARAWADATMVVMRRQFGV